MKYIKNNYNYLLFSFFSISIIAWFLEIGYSLIFRNKFVLPGAWYGPYCPIYGLTFILLLAVFKKDGNVIFNILKISSIIVVTEYIVSFISEKVFNRIIWNYSEKFLNLNGRICLEMSVTFIIVGVIMMYLLVPTTKKIYNKLGNSVIYMNVVLSAILLADIIFTLVRR